jgi:dipeptidase E
VSIILTSNGLTSEPVINVYLDLFKSGYKKSAIIVTADPVYREKNRKAEATKRIFDEIGFETDFFDIEFTPPYLLSKCDIVFFIGGNPFYLLNQVRKSHAIDVLKELAKTDVVISGSSAGSIILGRTIALIKEFDPQMNDMVGLTDFTGVHLTEINLCPHYSSYINRYENFEERICLVEKAVNINITRINDGEAIIINNDKLVRV